MPKKKKVKGSKKPRRVARIEASAEEGSGLRSLPESFARYYKPRKQPVTLRIDADILAFFRRGGRGYQTRINRALRKVMQEQNPGTR